jgi:DNA-binding NarL/FixJ family response regulator
LPAADCEEGFLAALADDPQLIRADYRLPQVNALQAVRMVRARQRRAVYRKGVEALLAKPDQLVDLLDALASTDAAA